MFEQSEISATCRGLLVDWMANCYGVML